MSDRPLCFVLMPFGTKPDPAGGPRIDFDRVYEHAIKPGVEDADMRPVRADEEKLGGIIHKAMFERLLICDFAVADLTTSNPNVMYELGVRHAARPRTTLTVYAKSSPLPFDVKLLRTHAYELGDGNAFPAAQAGRLRQAVARHLRELSSLEDAPSVQDSPLFQLITAWRPEPLAAAASESFHEQAAADEDVKQRLQVLRTRSRNSGGTSAELDGIRSEAFADSRQDPGVLSELLLTYRSVGDWSGMVAVYEAMPDDLRSQVPIRQQAAFAFNRRAEMTGSAEDRATAIHVLERLEAEQGPSSETSGLLGRIFKSQWVAARERGDAAAARRLLLQAVGAYVRGFETDWRDIYPGINAVTLLDVQGGERALAKKDLLLPVVRFATEQRLRSATPDYWDHATLLELAVLCGDTQKALDALDDVLAETAEPWQMQSTADNLRRVREAREERGQPAGWMEAIIQALDPRTADP